MGAGRPLVHSRLQMALDARDSGSEKMVSVMHLRSSSGMYGAEQVILAALAHADRSRFDVSLACFGRGRPEELVRRAQRLGVRADVLAGGRLDVLIVLRLARLLRKRRIAIVHTHDYKSDIVGLAAARLAGAKAVATPHAWSEEGGRIWFYERLDRFLLRFFDRVLPLHDGTRRTLLAAGVGEDKVQVVRIGIPPASEVLRPALDVRRELGIGEDARIISYVGRLARRKRVEDIITAFSKMRGKVRAKLLVVGDGPERERLEALAGRLSVSDDVVFAGFRPDRLDLLNASDLLVLASTHEGLPVCVMEAMSLGKPVAATRIDGLTDMVSDGVSGLLVPPMQPEILADAFVRILSERATGERMGEAGRRLVADRFGAGRMAAEYERVYSELAGGV